MLPAQLQKVRRFHRAPEMYRYVPKIYKWMQFRIKVVGLIILSLLGCQLFLLFCIIRPTGFGDYKNNELGDKQLPISANLAHYDEHGFILPCQIGSLDKEAQSAYNRAKSEKCKSSILRLSCDIRNGVVYPKQLTGTCPLRGKGKGEHLGCFRDDRKDRDLEYRFTFEKMNTPHLCVEHCYNLGQQFAGLQYSFECFCGSEFGRHGMAPQRSCNLRCSGDQNQQCGGFLAQNIYRTGVGVKANNSAHYLPWRALSLTEKKNPARLAFVFSVSGRAFRQIKRLLKSVYHKRNVYFFHVDSRNDYLRRQLKELSSKFQNIFVADWSLSTIWGGSSLLQMMLRSISDLLQPNMPYWDYILNLSESDYPVRPLSELTAFLTRHKDRVFLKSHGHETPSFVRKQGLSKTFLQCEGRMWRLGDRTLPKHIVIDGGSDWLALSRRFSSHVLNSNSELVTGLLAYYNYTLLPVESFFHTVVQNSEFCTKWVDNSLHIPNWKRKLGCKCQHKDVVDWCGCSPQVFLVDDYRLIKKMARSTFFVRKFEPSISQIIINKVDQAVYGPYAHDVANIDAYWENRYDLLDARVDDTHFSAYHTLALLSSRFLAMSSVKRCYAYPSHIIGANFFFRFDHFQGLIISFSVSVQTSDINHEVVLEAFVAPINHLMLAMVKSESPDVNILKDVYVSDAFDVKERLSRNWARLLGPKSRVGVVTTITTDNQTTFMANWHLVGSSSFHNMTVSHEEKQRTHCTELPDMDWQPGSYKLSITDSNGALLGSTKFAILPLTHLDRNPIEERSGAAVENIGNESQMVSTDTVKLQSLAAAVAEEHWSVQNLCTTDLKSNFDLDCGNFVPPCSKTTWSTFSPDPKSAFP